jgi:NTP pyrophosphatase (non-canonical NTP hydrolase)
MASLTFEELRDANVSRVSSFGHGGLDEWDVPRWFMAMTGEVGELGNLLKKVERGDFPLDQVIEEVAHELADIQIYLDLLSARLYVDLAEATITKFNASSVKINSPVRL